MTPGNSFDALQGLALLLYRVPTIPTPGLALLSPALSPEEALAAPSPVSQPLGYHHPCRASPHLPASPPVRLQFPQRPEAPFRRLCCTQPLWWRRSPRPARALCSALHTSLSLSPIPEELCPSHLLSSVLHHGLTLPPDAGGHVPSLRGTLIPLTRIPPYTQKQPCHLGTLPSFSRIFVSTAILLCYVTNWAHKDSWVKALWLLAQFHLAR